MKNVFIKIARQVIKWPVYLRIRMKQLSLHLMILNYKLAQSKSFQETVNLCGDMRRVNRKRYYYFIQRTEGYDK